MEQKKERSNIIDIMKAIMIISVVIYHLIYRQMHGMFDNIIREMIYISMPLFFLFAGAFYKDYGGSFINNLRMRLRKMLVMVLITTAVLLVVFGPYYILVYDEFTAKNWLGDILQTYLRPELMAIILPDMTGEQLFNNISPVWFIWALAFATVVFYAVMSFVKDDNKKMFISIAVLLIVGAICQEMIPHFSWSIQLAPFYAGIMMIGLALRRYDALEKLKKINLGLSCVIMIVAAVLHYIIFMKLGSDCIYQSILGEYEVSGRMRDILIFALGTNSPNLKEDDIKNMLNAAKTPKTIVLVTNYNHQKPDKYNKNNELIRKAKTLDSRVVIADWEAAVKGNPSPYFGPDDGVHPKQEGSKYFMEIIYRAAQTGYAQNVSGPNDSKCVCDEEEETGTWADEEFELTDEQVAGLLAIIKETSKNNLEAVKTEASYMINLYEDYNRSNTRTGEEFVKFVRMPVQNGGKFPNHAKYKEDFTGYSKEEVNAVKDIWVNGNRTMPVGIIKRAEIGKIQSATNDGESIDASNRKKYKSGKTKITSEGKTWIFYKFADNANRKGDAFGYPEDGAPNQTSRSTSTSAGASIAWSDDGWISGGLDGFYKDEASSWNLKIDKEANAEFATEVGSGGGSGPNKILLHSSESAGGFESTVKSMYPVTRSGSDNDTASRPPHFTVDIKNHKTYQHFSIKRTSGAIQYHDDIAGIQINIIGYTNNETVGGEWNLRKPSNFSVDDWGYLVKLMMSISEKAGIKLQSKNLDWSSDKDRMSENQMRDFNGVIGHMHAANNGATDPNDIWKTLEPLFEDNESGTGECQIETSTNGDLNATALKLAWPDRGHSPDNPTEAYRQALLEPDGVGTRRQGDGCSITGKSCDAFVATVLRHSGVDKDVPCCGAANMLNYLANSSKYTEIENSASTLKGGDIRASGGHIEMVVEVNGELGIASASHCNRTGEVGGFYDNSFRAFRFTGGGN